MASVTRVKFFTSPATVIPRGPAGASRSRLGGCVAAGLLASHYGTRNCQYSEPEEKSFRHFVPLVRYGSNHRDTENTEKVGPFSVSFVSLWLIPCVTVFTERYFRIQ